MITVFTGLNCFYNKEYPVVKNGFIDLSNWDFNSDGEIELKGDWQFFWKKLYSKGDELSKETASHLHVPLPWNGSVQNGEKINGLGYAAYKINIALPVNASSLGIKMFDASTSFSLWFNNEKILTNGIVSNAKETYKPATLPTVVELKNIKEKNEIIIEVANFAHYKGGLWMSPRIGNLKELQKHQQINILRDISIAGSLLVIAVFSIFMFFYFKKDKAPLYFSIFSIMFIFRALMTNERIMFQIFPDFNWHIAVKMIYLSIYLVFSSFLLYVKSVFHEYANKKIFNIILWPFLICALSVLFLPTYYFTSAFPLMEILIFIGCIWCFYVIIKNLKTRRDEAMPLLTGFIFLFYTIANDILHHEKIINTFFYNHYGLFVFMLIQTGNSIRRFGTALLKNMRELNAVKESFVESLEKQVKEKTRQLSESEARYRALIELSPDSIAVVSQGKFVFVNPACAEILGAESPSDFIDKSIAEVFHPMLRKALLKQFERFSKLRKKIVLTDNRFILKNGKMVYLEMNIMRIYYNKKPAILIMGRNNEMKIKQNTELNKLKQAVEHSPVSIVITDKYGDIEYTNPKFSEITGYAMKEALGQNPRVLKSGKHDDSFYQNIWETLKSGNIWSGEIYNKKKNGDFFWERANISAVKSGKSITHYIAVKEDISELKRVEKLKNDTELIMRHDMKNALSGIIGLSDLMLETQNLTEKNREFLFLINENASNLAAMVNNYMAIFKMEEGTYKLNPSNFNIVSMFHEIEKEFEKKLNEKKLKLNIKQDYKIINGYNYLEINAEKIYIKILFSNLLDNAIQASSEKSEINISINSKAKYYEIQMHNAGVIPKEIQNRFFDKFATSGKKKGTGLGTYSARLIARVHGGDITFATSEEEGTTLSIHLPYN